jgi:hypothetical protein
MLLVREDTHQGVVEDTQQGFVTLKPNNWAFLFFNGFERTI